MSSRALPLLSSSPFRIARRWRGFLPNVMGGALAASVLLAGVLTSGTARAQAINLGQIVQAELRPGWRTEQGTHMAALHLRLAEGWKTYWRVPGEAGIPPRLDWSRSQNVGAVITHWPRPIVFDQNGFRSIGYDRELVLPLEFSPANPARPMALQAQILIGVCRETCIPVDLSLSLALRDAGGPDALIAAALERRARSASSAGLGQPTCQITPNERGAELLVRAPLPRLAREEHMVLELPGSGYWVSDSETRREGEMLVARAQLRDPSRGPISLERSALNLTILTPDHMLTHRGCTGG